MRLSRVIVLIACLIEVSAAPIGWRQFNSSLHFSAMYPSSWSRLTGLDEQLDVLSPGERQDGVVIGPGQAEVTVEQLPGTTALRNWKRRFAGGHPISARSYRRPNESHSCARLNATTIDFYSGEGPKERAVLILCQAGGRRFGIMLRYWQDDMKEVAYLRTALRVARSIHPS